MGAGGLRAWEELKPKISYNAHASAQAQGQAKAAARPKKKRKVVPVQSKLLNSKAHKGKNNHGRAGEAKASKRAGAQHQAALKRKPCRKRETSLAETRKMVEKEEGDVLGLGDTHDLEGWGFQDLWLSWAHDDRGPGVRAWDSSI